MSSVALLLLLSAVLGTAFSLECFHCNTTNVDTCTISKLCSQGQDQCVTVITESTIISTSPDKGKFFRKSCGTKSDCATKFSMTLNETRQNTAFLCCDSNKCYTKTVEFPKVKKEKNGVKCPFCYEKNTETCKTTVSMDCTGEEKMCISSTFTMKIDSTNVTYAIQGCAHDKMCELKSPSILPGAQITVKTFACSGTSSPVPHLLGLVVYGLLMLKLIS